MSQAAGGGGVHWSMRATFRAGLVWALWLVLAAYVAALALHSAGWGPNWTGSYSTDVNHLGWVAVCRVGLRRPEVVFAAAAVTSYALGDTYYTAVQAMTGSVPFPSAGDVA